MVARSLPARSLSTTAAQMLLIALDFSTLSGPVSPKHSKASSSDSIMNVVDSTSAWLSWNALTRIALENQSLVRNFLRSLNQVPLAGPAEFGALAFGGGRLLSAE